MQNDHGLFNSARKRIDDWVLLYEEIRHVYAQGRARDLQLSMQVRTLFRRYLYSPRHKHHPDRRFTRNGKQFFESAVNSRDGSECRESLAVLRMYIFVLV